MQIFISCRSKLNNGSYYMTIIRYFRIAIRVGTTTGLTNNRRLHYICDGCAGEVVHGFCMELELEA